MSFFTFDECKPKDNQEIFYDYRNTYIYNTDITEKTNKENTVINPNDIEVESNRISIKSKFYKVAFNNKESNFTYKPLNPSSYIATNIYLYGLIHNNIKNITTGDHNVVGELVIEHISHTNPNIKLYTCFLLNLSENKTKSTLIDKFITNVVNFKTKNNIDLNLNNEIPTQHKCFRYTEMEESNYPAMYGMLGTSSITNEVFVFTTPIQITVESAKLFENLSYETKLFSKNAPISQNCIDMQYNDRIVEGFTEGLALDNQPNIDGNVEDGININTEWITDLSGNLTDLSGNYYNTDDSVLECSIVNESDETVKSIVVPLDNDVINDIDGYKMFINFLLFLIMCIVSYFVIPGFYKMAIIDNINTLNETASKTADYIRGADLLITIVIFTHIFAYLFYGISYSEYNILILSAFGFITFYILGFSLIQYKKLSDDWNISDINYPSLEVINGLTSIFSIIGIIWHNLKGGLLVFIICFTLLFLLLCNYTLPSNDNDDSRGAKWWILPMPIITILSPIIYLSIIGMNEQ
jgi:hypothetical protein